MLSSAHADGGTGNTTRGEDTEFLPECLLRQMVFALSRQHLVERPRDQRGSHARAPQARVEEPPPDGFSFQDALSQRARKGSITEEAALGELRHHGLDNRGRESFLEKPLPNFCNGARAKREETRHHIAGILPKPAARSLTTRGFQCMIDHRHFRIYYL